MAVDLITAGKLGFATEDRCLGVYVLDEKTGEVETIRTDRLVLATGGCGKVYLYTTNPDIATGDGVAMAWRAGAAIANMEFIQFHPTCLFHPKAKSFLISEAVRGEGGILRNSRGEDFMARYHPQRFAGAARYRGARDRRRDEALAARNAFISISRTSRAEFLQERFPHIYETCLQLRHRHGEATDPGGAGGALSMRRSQDRRERRDQSAGSLRHRRSGAAPVCMARIGWPAIRCSRAGGGASRLRSAGARAVRRRMPARAIALAGMGIRATSRTWTSWS